MALRRARSARLWLLGLTFLVGVTNGQTDDPQGESRCDFTNGICESWTTSECSTNGGCFKAVQARNTTDGPIRDHTKGTEDGWYVAAVFPPGTWTVQKPAVLQRITPGPFCFTGWYHVSGLRSPVLTFAATALTRRGASYSTEDTVFLKADFSQTRLWQKVVYEEDRSGNVTIFISSSNALNSLVGLDDLSIVPGKCPPANHDGSCTFDYKDQCGYTSSSPKGSWHLKTRYLIPQKGMALDDHTTGTPVGGYMYHRVDAYKTTSAELTSPPLAKPAKPTRCLRFFYYAVRGSSGLEVSVEFQRGVSGLSNNFRNLRNVSKPVWSRYRTSLVPNRWYPAESTFSVEENHWLNFRCFLDTPIKVSFFCAIDDIEVSDCSVEGQQFGCNFDNGSMCGWESSSEPGLIRWTLSDLASGRPLALRKDRTTGSPLGGFVYAENKAREVAKARLSSPLLDSSWNEVACFSFWHYTVVKDITTSVTLMVTSASGDVFWSSNGELKKSWSHQVILLQLQDLKNGPPERVFLDASLNSSLIAVDDLVLSLGHCPSYQNGLSCDFERGPCTWTNTLRTRNSATWRIQSGSVRTSLAHPHSDHTRNSTKGSYMFLSALARAYGQRAELVSEVVSFGSPGSLCMDFWFNVGGSGHSQLQVLTAVDSTGFNAVWSFKDDTAGHWLRGQMKVSLGHRVGIMQHFFSLSCFVYC
ncbi:MAM and LDL-receptor class A domain-containing protein 1 [Ixodes scapularis]|uniref:MAM and LDL-receptor class A domain-containing protein 1 n=1 Tax=Ixodes scapularis TaxID=6945 RepID=UPI001A9E3AE7|nr:MAM and LDL-receptor class A domain-containing protein 1 [Ixodes scapularis]